MITRPDDLIGRVFNVSPKQRFKNVRDSLVVLLVSMIRNDSGSRTAVALVAATMLQVLVVAVLLLPLGAVYVFGLCISTGISLWRLVQRDYGATNGDPSTANLTPALDILYVLPRALVVPGHLLGFQEGTCNGKPGVGMVQAGQGG